MDFFEIVTTCEIGLLIAVCGIILVSVGVIYAVNINKSLKNVIRATVSECAVGESVVGGMIMQCYDVTLAIPTAKGIVHKIIKKGNELPIGTIVNVYYDYKEDEVCIAELRQKDKDSLSKVFSVIGCVAIVVGLFVVLIKGVGFNGMVFGYSFGIAAVLAVIYLGIWLSIFRPIKLSNREEKCDKVRGVQVDYVKISSKNGNASYAPIYEYNYKGKIKKYKSQIGGTSPKYKQVGKEVTIVINRENSKVYCLEESRETSKMGIYIIILGVVVLIGIIGGLVNDLSRGI